MIFCERLKFLRQRRNLTQTEMAEKIGMSTAGYTKVEQGQRELKFEKLVIIREVTNESLDFLFGFDPFDKRGSELMAKFKAAHNQYNSLLMYLEDAIRNSAPGQASVQERITLLKYDLERKEEEVKVHKSEIIAYCSDIPGVDVVGILIRYPFLPLKDT